MPMSMSMSMSMSMLCCMRSEVGVELYATELARRGSHRITDYCAICLIININTCVIIN